MKEFIKDNFIIKYKKSFGLNSVKLKKRWFVTNGHLKELNDIYLITNFLNSGVTLSERLYCILMDINKKDRCPYCKEKDIKYANFIEGLDGYERAFLHGTE